MKINNWKNGSEKNEKEKSLIIALIYNVKNFDRCIIILNLC